MKSSGLNPAVQSTITSPISATRSWLEGMSFDSTPLLDVSQAIPGYPPPAALLEHLATALGRQELSRYGPVPGMPGLRDALATDMARAYRASLSADHVFISAGCNQAFCLAATALCAGGDELIIPTPYYFNHDMWLTMMGIKAVYLPTGDDMIPSVAEAAALITSRTKAILLVTPNNPSGAVYPPDLIAGFYELAASNEIALILDETYRDFLPTREPPHRLFARPNWSDTLIHLYSFSKVFSITGYRVGAMVAAPGVLHEVDKIADTLAICAPMPGQEAALFGLENLGAWRESNRVLMNDRVARFRSKMTEESTGYSVAAAGAYFAYVRHPFEGTPSLDVAQDLLAAKHVLAIPGSMFGPNQEGYLRLAFANLDFDGIDELVDRLAR